MTAIHKNYKFITNDAGFRRWFSGGNVFQIVLLRENKIDNLYTKTGTVYGQQEPIHSFCCWSRVFLHGKQCVPPLPVIKVAIMSVQFPFADFCEQGQHLYVISYNKTN